MVRSDKAGAGVMFSIDTETGFPRTVLINAAWGLGETVVQGIVDPDEYHVFKPLLGDETAPEADHREALGAKARKMVYAAATATEAGVDTSANPRSARFVLSDDEILTLARWACAIEGTTASRWTSSGPRTARRTSSTSCRRGRRRCSRKRGGHRCAPIG
jgi:pyruvate, water dikinase